MKQPFFIFDVESIGLHGEAFAVAAQVFDGDGNPMPLKGGWWHCIDRDTAKGAKADRDWVDKNVPLMAESMPSARMLRNFFWGSWEEAQSLYPGIMMAAECCWPVEARFLLQCVADEPESRTWNGIYPLHDIASIMLAAGMDPLATYPRSNDAEYPAHHPLGDVQHSAHCLALAIQKLTPS